MTDGGEEGFKEACPFAGIIQIKFTGISQINCPSTAGFPAIFIFSPASNKTIIGQH